MGFIQNNDTISFQERIMQCFGQKNAVGHEFDSGLLCGLIVKPDGIADQISQRPELLADPAGDGGGGNPAGLGASDQGHLFREGIKTEFGNLRRLAGTGVACDYHNLPGLQKTYDFVPVGQYRKVFRGWYRH